MLPFQILSIPQSIYIIMNLRIARKVLKNEERYAGHQLAEAKAIVERWKRNPKKEPKAKWNSATEPEVEVPAVVAEESSDATDSEPVPEPAEVEDGAGEAAVVEKEASEEESLPEPEGEGESSADNDKDEEVDAMESPAEEPKADADSEVGEEGEGKDDSENLKIRIGEIVSERERMFGQLVNIPGVIPWPSQANFILCQITRGDAKKVFESLARRGIFLRYFSSPRLVNFIRASVGLESDNDVLIDSLKDIMNDIQSK